MKTINIINARSNNLQNISIELPREQMIVFSGLSGSGKSSLAFETLFKEGQKRFLESISNSSSLIGGLDTVDVDDITGLTPTIAIDQKSKVNNPRSTVGTLTEIYDFLRILFTNVGTPYNPSTQKPYEQSNLENIINEIAQLKLGTKLSILSPILRGKKGRHDNLMAKYEAQGFSKLRINGQFYTLGSKLPLSRVKESNVDLIVDRIIIKQDNQKRLRKSIETALKIGDNTVIFVTEDDEFVRSLNYIDPQTLSALPKITARIFSFNSPHGYCDHCQGLGNIPVITIESLISYPEESLWDNPILRIFDYFPELEKTVKGFYKRHKIKESQSIQDLDTTLLQQLTHGNDKFLGLIQFCENILSEFGIDYLFGCYQEKLCPHCHGQRLAPFPLTIKIQGKNIADLSLLPLDELYQFIRDLQFNGQNKIVADKILHEILPRLQYLNDVGLGYLHLHRNSQSLSGGELQRIRLSNQLGTYLSGVIYILDEPSIGLHQRDNKKLIQILHKLKNQGNTVIVVEHDEETIQCADHIVDIGPLTGSQGGKVIYEGNYQGLLESKESITGQYISGRQQIAIPSVRRPAKNFIKLKNANIHNVVCANVQVPKNSLVCITGVSGSGKSSLFSNVLLKAIKESLSRNPIKSAFYESINGCEDIDSVLSIDQTPIGRNAKSIPATYAGLFDHVRQLFAQSQYAKVQGYGPGYFSFNTASGRCPTCNGHGQIKSEIPLLSESFFTCQTCKGKRYNDAVIEARFKGLSIADVLNLTIDDALEFFAHHRKIRFTLQTLSDVGLGYLRLGQPTPTLSGGEAQRLKLSKELAKIKKGKCLYFLDEPSTGLHFHDINLLLKSLHALIEKGHSVIVIEHNLDIIKCADYIIDMGPEGGKAGGKIVAQGSPEEICQLYAQGKTESITAPFLHNILTKNS